MPAVSIVLPILNERENIAILLDELENALSGIEFEVIAVDDGSTDGTRELLKELCQAKPYLKLIFFRRNFGQAAAFDAGFRSATAPVVVTLDADRQNDPADIPMMLRKLDEGFDLVAGRRANRKDAAVHRKLPSRIANFIIRAVTRTELRDLGCSLKVYRLEFVRDVRLYGEMHRFLGVTLQQMGARVTEVDVNHRARVAGTSKYGLARTFKVILDLMTIWFLAGYQTKPIYVFGGAGLVMLMLSGLISLYVLYEKIFDGAYVHRNPRFILSMVFALVSVQLFAIGLLAEMLARTYFESQGRAPYTVRERHGFKDDA